MRFWWVNQNQTYEKEFSGSYIWSPKRRANNSRNPFYEFMREVSPGDIVLSFNKTLIAAVSVAASHCYDANDPKEGWIYGLPSDFVRSHRLKKE